MLGEITLGRRACVICGSSIIVGEHLDVVDVSDRTRVNKVTHAGCYLDRAYPFMRQHTHHNDAVLGRWFDMNR